MFLARTYSVNSPTQFNGSPLPLSPPCHATRCRFAALSPTPDCVADSRFLAAPSPIAEPTAISVPECRILPAAGACMVGKRVTKSCSNRSLWSCKACASVTSVLLLAYLRTVLYGDGGARRGGQHASVSACSQTGLMMAMANWWIWDGTLRA